LQENVQQADNGLFKLFFQTKLEGEKRSYIPGALRSSCLFKSVKFGTRLKNKKNNRQVKVSSEKQKKLSRLCAE